MKNKIKKELPTSFRYSKEKMHLNQEEPTTQDNIYDAELRGYPHYPAREDITNPGIAMEKVELNEEEFSRQFSAANKKSKSPKPKENKSDEEEFEEDDLDVPGAELDDEEEMIGEEDEENNSYSIGGDRHDDLEENGSGEERI